MRLSISAKIFVGFLVVLATFGGVLTYGAVTMRRLGDELRLVSRGYLELRLQVSELQNRHSNLLKELDNAGAPQRLPPFIKYAIDDARRIRLKQHMPQALADVRALEQLRSSPEEHRLLDQLRGELEAIQQAFKNDEELFDEVYGPVGDQLVQPSNAVWWQRAAERLLARERLIKRQLTSLSAELRLRGQQAGLRLEQSENRAVWATLLLAVIAVLVGVGVLVMVARTLSPLRRLAERAKEIARGDYKQRVEASSGDEIGDVGREFNAMAQALEEREQQLIRSERLATVGKIAAQITHEVRNPLSSIGLNAEMLEEELLSLKPSTEGMPHFEEAQRLVRAIVKEVDRLADITEEYLRFARLPRPKLEHEDLNAIVSSLLSFLKPELESRKVQVTVEMPPHLPIDADEHQLRQALLNLFRNAGEAMKGGGTLRVGARYDASTRSVELSIADTGQGIAPEHLKKIFDPFFSTKEGGTGLGLALTQQIVAEHGGSISVESEPGRGTRFVVRLPALDPAEHAPARGEEPVTAALATPGARE